MIKALATSDSGSGMGAVIQGFAPRSIEALTTGSQDTTNWLAFCFPEVNVTYQINDAGGEAILPAGAVRVVDRAVESITFTIIGTAKCEVM
jgi:hypothetical protein